MAKIAMISCNDRCCMGARQLSSLVKNRHAFYLICYGEYHHATFSDTAKVGDETDEVLLLDLLRRLSPDLVGFSYRSIQAKLATHLANRIRSELKLAVTMGGIGATSEPDTAMLHCDIVCIGEGDFVLPRLLDAIDETCSLDLAVRNTPNLWYHTDKGVARNPLERLVSREELSKFPFIDYDADNKFTIVRGELMERDGRFDNDDDRRDTLDLMQAMPKSTQTNNYERAWYCCQSRLTYFPHSRISHMVEEQGINTEFDPDLASFWEMLHEIAFMDHLPQSAVMYLSYLFDEYRESSGDFRPETGALYY